ncbi:MAG: AMP-dependent synthetase [Leptolyngbya foveolarum]|uniref:AMP-dependent synthetase n=1 Tax=Leptolyngbya foveolarum TaxID=47253 RepID=A0A2W4W673_9CYAN|nr:MAG: AMP-dependent synthetase [Leptolyngbya foveolarum]
MTVCFTRDSASRESIPSSRSSNLVALSRERATYQGSKLAYRFLQDGETESGRLSYQDIDLKARAIAQKLQSSNATGDRVLLIFPPGLDFITAFFGCLYAGAIAVPAYPPRRNQNLPRLQAIIDSSGSTFALTTSSLLARIAGSFSQSSAPEQPSQLAALHWIATDAIETENAQSWQPPDIDPQDLAFIQYTSGSTGDPKGVKISHRNILHNSALIQQSFSTTPEDSGVSWLPPYHDMGLIGCILQPMFVGASMTLMPPLAFLQQPIRWLQAISDRQATASGGPNFAYDLCVRKVKPAQLETLDLSRWKVAFTGAEPVRAATLARFAEKFAPCGFRETAFHPCYGMAETTLIVSGKTPNALPVVQSIETASLKENRVKLSTDDAQETQSVASCGQPLEGVEVVIVDPNALTLCSDRQVGEIWIKGESVAQGYWNQPALTQKIFNAWLLDNGDSPQERLRQRKGPYLRTGDLGFLQSNELFVTGRIKDLMIIRGQNHYPQDVEATVEAAHAALRSDSGAVFTIEVSAKGSVEEKVVVVQEVKRSYLRKLDPQAVIDDVRAAVTRQHGLQVYAIALIKTGSIPKTSSGKIRRSHCKTQFSETSLNVVGSWSENPRLTAEFVRLDAEMNALLEKLG